ncbi:hypothetical protein [Hydrogenophaga sp.]|uniref:hypothetical protein n=1 Tax=Hydrogenophaga sp. TaxID=1904254 RepID=UPI002731B869|nr:hypothetical protein [Hydrogenophaga sp.]MDP1686897.1 hypothetical protein [Hydrogenophaga sp.]
MKHLVLLFIALCAVASQPARADSSCVPYLECQPLTTQAVRGPLATHLFWFVRNAETGGIDHHGFSCKLDKCDLQLLIKTANEVLTGLKTPGAAWDESMNFGCDYSRWEPYAGQNEICAERKLALATMRDVWLAGIPRQIALWRVKSNGLSSSRPAYTLTGSTRGTKEVARATVGTACDVKKPTLPSGSDLWAEFGTAGVVALCAKVLP